ncbi:MAG TPA: hypothetical protein VEC38_04850 [Candidatus Binataceae bacterium]|nr:hypothetical protein [Candidatus Binataceae bacterium]
MLTERQRAILHRIHRLHQCFWFFAAAAIVAPLVVAEIWPAPAASSVMVAMVLAAIVCAGTASFTICPRCQHLFHSFGTFIGDRCQVCALSCRNPDDSPDWSG